MALYAPCMAVASDHPGPLRQALAWGVHLYTALGAVVGFIALVGAFNGDYKLTFAMLALALAIDASDGALARSVRVKQTLPLIDGEILDNIVDYFTYVVVPVAVFVQPGILPDGLEYCAVLVLVASAYGFCRTDAKGMIEHYFRGFPSYWNVIAFYAVVLQTAPAVNLAAIVTAVVFVFVPMRWLYPSRMEVMRAPTIALGLVWAVMGTIMIVRLPEPSPTLGAISLFYPVYYTIGSVVYHFRR